MNNPVPATLGLAPEVAMDKLKGLESALDIAEFLASEGIVGTPRDAKRCPIATWLMTKAPLGSDSQFWNVAGNFICVRDAAVEDEDGEPRAVAGLRWSTDDSAISVFIEHFDQGGFDNIRDPDSPPVREEL